MPRARFVFVAAGVIACSIAVPTQSPRPMGIVDLLNVPRVGGPGIVARWPMRVYTRGEADWKADRRISHIWRAAPTAASRCSSPSAPTARTTPRWSPDGKTIAFIAKRGDDESAQIYLLPVDGGEARQLTTHASAVSRHPWSPDGAALYFTAADPKTAEEKARDKVKDDVYAYDENYKQTHLWKIAVGDESGNADHRRRLLGHVLRAVRRRPEDRATTGRRRRCSGRGDESEVWVVNADGIDAAPADEEQRPGERRRAVARRFAGAVHLRSEREVRDLLQRPAVRRPGGRRRGARPGRRERTARRRPRDVVEGRPDDLLPGQHRRPRGAVQRARGRRHAAAADRRQARHRLVSVDLPADSDVSRSRSATRPAAARSG